VLLLEGAAAPSEALLRGLDLVVAGEEEMEAAGAIDADAAAPGNATAPKADAQPGSAIRRGRFGGRGGCVGR